MSAASLLPDEVPQWVLACGLSLVGTTCSTLGLNVQKLGHVHHAAAERRAARALERRRRQADVQWERARLHAGASVGGGAYGVDKTVIGGAGDDDYDDGGDVERGVASPLLAPGGSGPSSGASSGAATTVGTSAGIGPDAGFGAGADGDTGSDVNPFAVAGFGAGSNSSSLSGGGLSAPSGARTPARKHAHAHADVNSCAGAGASTGKAVSSAFASVLAPVPPVYRHPVWLFGLGIFLLGEVLTGVAMGFGSQSLVAVLSSCALLSNALFAALIHGERASRGYAVAAAAIIAGAICVVLAAPHGNQDYDLAKLSRLFRSALFHTFAAAVLVLLALALCARALLPRSALLAALVAALVASFSVLFAKCSMQLVKASVEQLTRATVSATQSAGQTVSAVIAGAAAAVTGTAATNSAANGTAVAPASVPVAVPVPVPGEQSVDIFQPLSWLIFLLFIFCASVTMYFLNQALRRGRAVVVYPFYFAFSTLLVLCSGLIFFQEYRELSPPRAAVFAAGLALTLWGMRHAAAGAGATDGADADPGTDADEDEGLMTTEMRRLHGARADADAGAGKAAYGSFAGTGADADLDPCSGGGKGGKKSKDKKDKGALRRSNFIRLVE